MFELRQYKFAALYALVLSMAGGAQAATLTAYNDVDLTTTPDTLTDERFTLECNLGCRGAIFSSDDPLVVNFQNWNTSFIDLVDNLSGAPQSTSFVNGITTKSYDKDVDRIETDRGGVSSASFTSSAEYILFKIGQEPNIALIENTGGFGNLFTFTDTSASGASGFGSGLSNTEEFGMWDDPSGTVIPLPAGLPLLLSALGIGGLLRLRQRKAA